MGASLRQGVISEGLARYSIMVSPAGTKRSQYGRLEQIQGEIRYAPNDFQAFVNVADNTISISVIGYADPSAFTHIFNNVGQLFASTRRVRLRVMLS